MKFVDEAIIDVAAGDGGNGCAASFRHEKVQGVWRTRWWRWRAWGHLLAVADASLNTLVDFRFTRRFEAQRGEHGKGSAWHEGGDIVPKMPVGTIITNLDSGEVLHELLVPGEQVTLAKGGDGGFGNMHYKEFDQSRTAGRKPRATGERRHSSLN
ncbi:MAG: hypothetical protein R3E42_17640 [Burkholderiaceae bacterium]